MKKFARHFLLIFFLTFPVWIFAGEISVRVRLNPPTVGLSETSSFSIEIQNARVSQITPPTVNGLHFQYTGTSTSSSVNMINGKISSKTVYAQNFNVYADKTGTYTIPSITLSIKGKSFSSKPVTLKVVKQTQHRQNKNQRTSLLDQFFAHPKKITHLYLRLYPKFPSVYQNQAQVIDAILFSEDKEALNYHFVEASGLLSDRALVYDISQSIDTNHPDISISRDQNGTLYYGKVYKRYVVFPIDKGQIAIQSPRVVAVSPAGQIEVAGKNIRFESLKLGDRAGINYIGDLTLSWQSYSNELEAGKPINITLKMRGSGNLKMLANPYDSVQIPGVFLSVLKQDLHFDSFKGGRPFFTQTITYTLMAQKEGTFSVPDLKIDAYNNKMDPIEKTLKGFTVQVHPSGNLKRQAEHIGNPIIITDSKKSRYLLLHPGVLLVLFLSLMLPFLSFPVGIHRKRLQTDPDYARKVQAGQRFGRYLKTAESCLKEEDLKGFYHELNLAVFRFLTDKYSLPSGIRLNQLEKALIDKKVPETWTKKSIDLIRICQQNAYASEVGSEDASAMLDRAIDIFGTLRKNRF